MIPLLLSCGTPEHAVVCSEPEYAAVSVLTFGRVDGDHAPGFDLDGHVTALGDGEGCGKADYVDAEGRSGIDNAFAGLLPVLDATEASALEPLVQDFINNGTILLVAEMGGFEAEADPACGSFRILHGADVPLVGTDGFLLPGQTLHVDDADRIPVVTGGVSADGSFEAEGFGFDLDVQIFSADIDLPVSGGAIRVTRDEAAERYVATIGGGFPYDAVLDALLESDIDQGLKDLLPGVLDAAADLDLDGDGTCESLSATLEVALVGVWLYP